jgi:predicted CopG family antitoxin
MPVEGFKSITVNEATYEKLEEIANKNHRSIAQTIEHLLENCKQEA